MSLRLTEVRRRISLLALALLLSATGVARADQTDQFVQTRMDEFHIPGLSLAIIKRGETVKVAGYGFADPAGKVPTTPDTVYKIGSVSKQLIATGIMLLVQEG